MLLIIKLQLLSVKKYVEKRSDIICMAYIHKSNFIPIYLFAFIYYIFDWIF